MFTKILLKITYNNCREKVLNFNSSEEIYKEDYKLRNEVEDLLNQIQR